MAWNESPALHPAVERDSSVSGMAEKDFKLQPFKMLDETNRKIVQTGK